MEPSVELSLRHTFWERYHPALSDAVYRIKHERPGHGYRLVAEQEITALWHEATDDGLSLEEFLLLCNEAYERSWENDEGEVFIETTEGNHIYNGKPAGTIGPGQLPPGQASIDVLRRSARV